MSDRSTLSHPSKFEISRNIGFRAARAVTRDRVVIALALIATAAALIQPTALGPLLGATLQSLIDTAPFIAASVLIAAGVKASGADRLIGRALAGKTHIAVVTAALFGALSPFCSCGVVPLIAALLAAGVPLAPVMAFWLASPVIDPEMMVLSWGVLGAEITLAKTLSAVALGLLGGATVMLVDRAGGFGDVLKGAALGGCATGCGVKSAIDPDARPVWAFWREGPRRRLFAQEAARAGLFLAKWLTLAFLLEAIMLRTIPMDRVAAGLADLGLWSIPAAAAVGVPSYLNGYAAIPLVRGLMDVGLTPGAALSFMVAGGITSVPAAIAVHALVRWPVFLTYLAVAAVGSVGVGLLYALWGTGAGSL
ncbi:MAG: permease [Marivibrio sp.]|uniref:permease n=1 Tax=Marivibrio sp. TaxID=2039719 RepID=UPI0032ED8117